MLADSAGVDLVRSTVSKTLAAGFEKLTLLGAAAINGTGNAAANVMTGNAGNNKLFGLGGNDTINGGARNDILTGGLGKDTMTGGAGADDFDFNSVAEIGKGATRDIIRDFVHLIDDIDLSTIDANGAAAGNSFTFLATKGAAFTGVAGELRWFQDNLAGRRQRPDHHRRRHQRQPRRRLPDSAHWPEDADGGGSSVFVRARLRRADQPRRHAHSADSARRCRVHGRGRRDLQSVGTHSGVGRQTATANAGRRAGNNSDEELHSWPSIL